MYQYYVSNLSMMWTYSTVYQHTYETQWDTTIYICWTSIHICWHSHCKHSRAPLLKLWLWWSRGMRHNITAYQPDKHCDNEEYELRKHWPQLWSCHWAHNHAGCVPREGPSSRFHTPLLIKSSHFHSNSIGAQKSTRIQEKIYPDDNPCPHMTW